MPKVTLACQKGGVGKSTIALHLMASSISAGVPAALYDADPQESCIKWNAKRLRLHQTRAPIFKEEADAKAAARFLVVDTPPHADALLPRLLNGSDLVLIPTRPGGMDLESTMETIDLVRKLGHPLAVVIALPTPRMPEIVETVDYLRGHEVAIAGYLHHRVDVSRACFRGLLIDEYDARSQACAEFAHIYEYTVQCINASMQTRTHALQES